MKPLTREQMRDIFEDGNTADYIDGVSFVDMNDWYDHGKFSTAMVVVRDTAEEQDYGFYVSRSGSYFTDYDYNFSWIGEVEKRVKTTHEWVQVK